MPETNFTITQGTLTITEHGNSVPYSGKLDDLSLHPVKEVIDKVLKLDACKDFDIDAYDQFDATPLRVTPTGGTSTDGSIELVTTGTATSTTAVEMDNLHVKSIVDTMKERNIPPYMMDDYFCISHPTTLRTFKNCWSIVVLVANAKKTPCPVISAATAISTSLYVSSVYHTANSASTANSLANRSGAALRSARTVAVR